MTTSSTTVETDDATLIRRVQGGDAAAYEPLVLRYQDRIHAVVYRMVGNREDACDLTQDALICAFRALQSFRSESTFHTWLFRIAVNTVISYRRKRRIQTVATVGGAHDEECAGAEIDPPDDTPGPAETAETEERRHVVLAAVDQLEPEFRDAIALRDLQGYSYDEMAEIIGCPVGTVKSRIHRARLALRELLAPFAGDVE